MTSERTTLATVDIIVQSFSLTATRLGSFLLSHAPAILLAIAVVGWVNFEFVWHTIDSSDRLVRWSGKILAVVVCQFFSASLAVAWHRHLLLGEKMDVFDFFQLRNLCYLRDLACIWFLCGLLPMNLVWWALERIPTSSNLDVLLVWMPAIGSALTLGAIVPVIIFLVLPATALNHKLDNELLIARSKRNFGALLCGYFICILLPWAALLLLPVQGETQWGFTLALVALYSVSLIVGMVGWTFLSLAYLHLFPEMFEPSAGETVEPG